MTYAVGSIIVDPQSACTIEETGLISGWLPYSEEEEEEGDFSYTIKDIEDGEISAQEDMAVADALPCVLTLPMVEAMGKAESVLEDDGWPLVETFLINDNLKEVDDSLGWTEAELISQILAAQEDTYTLEETVEIDNS